MIQLSNPHINTGKTTALSRQTFVPKMMYLVFNTLSRFVIAFLHSITSRLSSLYSSSHCPNSKPSKLKLERKYSGIVMLFYHPKSFYFTGYYQLVSSVAQSCLTVCNPMNCSTPDLPVHHQLPKFTQTHVH